MKAGMNIGSKAIKDECRKEATKVGVIIKEESNQG
jgi:hypothetical protein